MVDLHKIKMLLLHISQDGFTVASQLGGRKPSPQRPLLD